MPANVPADNTPPLNVPRHAAVPVADKITRLDLLGVILGLLPTLYRCQLLLAPDRARTLILYLPLSLIMFPAE
jgi:hypothetical protein